MDSLDKTILFELLKDGRKSFTAIAKENGISEDTVWKHYKEMEKEGIIVGATIQYNYPLFGCTAVATLRLKVESQNIKDVCDQLEKNINMRIYRSYNDAYPLLGIFLLNTLIDLEHSKEVVSRTKLINGMKTYLWLHCRNTPENIVLDSYQQRAKQVDNNSQSDEAKQKDTVKLDEIDMKIVDKLTKNGRMPFSKIAEEIGVSTDTISKRYEKLKKNNYFKVSVQIDPAKLGYQAHMLVQLAISAKNEIPTIVEKLSKVPGVSYIVKLTGDYDLLLCVFVKDCNDIISFNKEIEKIPHVIEIEVSLMNVDKKEFVGWPGPRQYISTF